jgi:hypothetical protein
MSLEGHYAPIGLLTHWDLRERRMQKLNNDVFRNSHCSNISFKGDQIKEDEMGEIHSTHGEDIYTKF